MVMAWLVVHPRARDKIALVISTVIFLAQDEPFAFPTICEGTELFVHTVERVTVPLITMVIYCCNTLDVNMISSGRVGVATRPSVDARWMLPGSTCNLVNLLFNFGLLLSDKCQRSGLLSLTCQSERILGVVAELCE